MKRFFIFLSVFFVFCFSAFTNELNISLQFSPLFSSQSQTINNNQLNLSFKTLEGGVQAEYYFYNNVFDYGLGLSANVGYLPELRLKNTYIDYETKQNVSLIINEKNNTPIYFSTALLGMVKAEFSSNSNIVAGVGVNLNYTRITYENINNSIISLGPALYWAYNISFSKFFFRIGFNTGINFNANENSIFIKTENYKINGPVLEFRPILSLGFTI